MSNIRLLTEKGCHYSILHKLPIMEAIELLKEELKKSHTEWVLQNMPVKGGIGEELANLAISSFNDKLDVLVQIAITHGEIQGLKSII